MTERPAPPSPDSRPLPTVPRFKWEDFDRRGQAYERIKKRTGCVCEDCRRQCKRPGEAADAKAPSYLIVHQDGNSRNYDDHNLWLVCEDCYRRSHTLA